MAKEQNGAKVKEDGDPQYNRVTHTHVIFVKLFRWHQHIYKPCVRGHQNSHIEACMQKGKWENCYYQSEEVDVVSASDTVIEPFAVMIEIIDTSIALATVLSCVTDICLADFAIKSQSLGIKDLATRINNWWWLTLIVL